MTISHILFDLHGTLLDRALNARRYGDGLASYMAEHYGGMVERWRDAHDRILADWDSYHADLDLGDDDGIEQMWEGQFRTTRALFRLTGTPEPSHDDLWRLTRLLPEQSTTLGGSALYDDAPPVLERLHAAGYTLGTVSNSPSGQVRGSLNAAGVLELFSGPLFGADLAGCFGKDVDCFRRIARDHRLVPAACVIVEDDARVVADAREAGFLTAHIQRGALTPSKAHIVLHGTLTALPDELARLKAERRGA